MKSILVAIQLCGALSMMSIEAMAQTPPKPASAAAATLPAPDRTTASFGDWILRCEVRGPSVCELGQAIQKQGEAGPQAQIAVGRISATDPLRFTVLLPNYVALNPAPKVTLEGSTGQTLDLAWVRCVPTGCFANVTISEESLKKFRQQKDAGRLEYRDGADRETVVHISFRGFREALDAFQRETAK